MIKERFISKFSLLLDVRNLTFGARHIILINLAQKQGCFICVSQPRWQICQVCFYINFAFAIKALHKFNYHKNWLNLEQNNSRFIYKFSLLLLSRQALCWRHFDKNLKAQQSALLNSPLYLQIRSRSQKCQDTCLSLQILLNLSLLKVR